MKRGSSFLVRAEEGLPADKAADIDLLPTLPALRFGPSVLQEQALLAVGHN